MAMRWARVPLAVVWVFFGSRLAGSAADAVPVMNGFKLAPAAISAAEIREGGPPRDGIPALRAPKVVPAKDSPWPDDEVVVGVALGGQARAYPLAILTWHELVNDTLAGRHILVSFCPLCGTALVFDREAGGSVRSFGVSGLLYNSDLLLYDHETESLWSQIASSAVTGPAMGTRLRVLRSAQLPWRDWKERYPDTTVLSRDTGHRRPYGRDPYAGYSTSESIMFPAPLDGRYHPKMPTLGVRLPGGAARAYPAVELSRAGGRVEESFEGHRISIGYDPEEQVFRFDAPPEIEVIEGYWFAWAAFHPKTTVFRSERGGTRPSKAEPDEE
jgi:hypothetical protein